MSRLLAFTVQAVAVRVLVVAAAALAAMAVAGKAGNALVDGVMRPTAPSRALAVEAVAPTMAALKERGALMVTTASSNLHTRFEGEL